MFGVVPAVLHGRAANEAGLWVDPVSGSDGAGTGTKLSPYQTVAKALTIAGAGTVINCMSGVFSEFSLASATNGLAIRAGNGFSPVFSGAAKATVWTLDLGNAYWATISAQALLSAWNGETRLTHVADIATCRTTTNSYFDDVPGLRVYVNIGGGAPTLIYYSQSGRAMLGNIGTSCRLDNIAFKWNDIALQPSTCSYTLNNCSFNHTASFVGSLYIQGAVTTTLNGCTFVNMGTQVNGAISMVSGAQSVVMSGCTLTGTAGSSGVSSVGVKCDATGGTLSMTDCTLTSLQDGIDMRAAGGGAVATVVRCTFVDCGHGCARAGVVASNKVTCSFCIAYNSVGQAPGYGFIVDLPASGTFVNCSTYGLGGNGFFCNGATAVMTVINCIAANGGVGSWGINNTGPGTLTEHHNCIFNNGLGSVSGGPAASDVLTNPQFIAAPANLRLTTPGSPCLDAGVAQAPYTNGATNFDIGRYVRGLT